MEKIKVLIYTPGEPTVMLKEIDNELATFQKIVGGYIECVKIGPDLYLICNEEGKIRGLDPNIFVNGDIIAGTCIIAADDVENDDFKSLTVDQMTQIVTEITKQNLDRNYLLQRAKETYYKE